VRLRSRLKELRGRKPLREIAAESGVHRGTLSMIESGRLLPKDEHVEALERAYAAPRTDWYSAAGLLAIEEDDEEAA
jgi:transcriptional regulator with XRE-family HTH domain